MHDREMLERAAKAYGVVIDMWQKDGNGVDVAYYINDLGGHSAFQPLHENQFTDCMGDALRLAVACRLDLMLYSTCKGAFSRGQQYAEDGGEDPYDATRRAIVRAAAAMAPGEG